MVYSIEINLPDNMAPVAVNNDRLATNGGAIMVEDVDDEDEFADKDEAKPKFNNEHEDKPVTAVLIPLSLPHIPPPGVAAAAPRQGS